jgi:predicted GTPase/uncharacterized protein (DUF697 family)
MTKDQDEIVPRLAVVGKTGAGKSSLVNALLEADIQLVDVVPTTQEATPLSWQGLGSRVLLVDTAGVGEAGREATRSEALFELLSEAHVIVWVLGFPSRDLDSDLRILREIRQLEPRIPIVVAASGVDRVSRSFDARTFNLDNGNSANEVKVREWLTYLRTTLGELRPTAIVACSSGEGAVDKIAQYNLKALHQAMQEAMPEAQRIDFIRRSRVLGDVSMKAHAIVAAAVAAAAAAALSPIPLSDAIPITAIQIGMVISLAALHGQTLSWSTAGGLVTSACAAVAGPMIVQQVMKFIPVAGSVTGPAIAGVVTAAIGEAVHALLKDGRPLTPEELKRATKEMYKKLRSQKK